MQNRFHQIAVLSLIAAVSVLAGSVALRAADNDKQPLQLNLKKGESHKVAFRFKVETIGDDGKKQTMKNLEADLKLTVVEVDEQGNSSIEVQFNRLVTFYPDGIDFDSTAPKGSKRNNSLYANAILENPQTYTLSRMGQLSATVKGGELIGKAFDAANKEYAQSRDFAAQDSFVPATLNHLNQFLWGVAFVKFSTAPVGVGDTWTFTPPAADKAKRDQPFGSIKYTLRSRDKGAIALDAEVIALEPHGKDKPAEMKFPFQIELDAQSGWPKSAKMEMENKSPKAVAAVSVETKD